MNYTVCFSPEAQSQLEAIEEYIALISDSPTMASRYIESIVAYCESFHTFPQRGTRRDDLMPGLRVIGYRKSATIAFLVNTETETVSIVGIFYGGQDYETILHEKSNPVVDFRGNKIFQPHEW